MNYGGRGGGMGNSCANNDGTFPCGNEVAGDTGACHQCKCNLKAVAMLEQPVYDDEDDDDDEDEDAMLEVKAEQVVSSSDVSPIGTGCCGVKGASPTPEGQHFTRYLGGGGGTSLATCKAKCNKDPECVAMDNGKSGCNIYITNNARTGLNNFVSTDSSTNWLKGNPATGTLSLGNVQASPGKWCVNNNFKCYAKAPLPTKTGVGCCDWHYKDVSGTATSLAACAQDCEKEANCEQFSYGKVAGAPSCRISKCGSYPGGTPCPDDEQCPITRTHPACMASNTYTIHDPCAAKCGPTCKGPDDASRPECTVCAQCHAMFVQADVEQTSQADVEQTSQADKVETEVEAPCAYGKITAVGHGNAPVGSCCPGPNRNQGTCSNSHPLMYGKTQSVCWTVLGDNWGYCEVEAPLPTKTGVGCCDWHYKDVSGTATSLTACAQDCEKEANCEQFSYGKVAGAPSCRISKCGSYPGGTPCPDDEQCPITRTHPACMASNTYTIHDPCAAKCGPTCKGPDDASRPECTVCAQCHAMFVQADVEQTSQEARHTEFDRKTKGTTNI